MTDLEANQRDARRYRLLRTLICADEAQQREIHALIAPALGTDGRIEPARIDRAMDLALTRMQIL